MKKNLGILLIITIQLMMLLSMLSSCVSSKRQNKTEKQVASAQVERQISTNVMLVDSAQLSLKESLVIEHFNDALNGTLYLSDNQSDSIESTGIKITASLYQKQDGIYGVRINAKSKPIAKTSISKDVAKDSGSKLKASVEDDGKETTVVSVEELSESQKKRTIGAGGGYFSCLFSPISYGDLLNGRENERQRNDIKGIGTVGKWAVDTPCGVATDLWTTDKQLESRQMVWHRYRLEAEGRHYKLQKTNSVCSINTNNGCLQRSNRQGDNQFVQQECREATLFERHGVSRSPC